MVLLLSMIRLVMTQNCLFLDEASLAPTPRSITALNREITVLIKFHFLPHFHKFFRSDMDWRPNLIKPGIGLIIIIIPK